MDSPFAEFGPAISPGGDWVAYVSDESGRPEVYVRAFPDGGRPYPISTEVSYAPSWAPDGSEIYLVTRQGVVAARVDTESGVVVESRSDLFGGPFELVSSGGGAEYDVAPDGRFVSVFETAAQGGASLPPVVVLNVFEELRQRLGESRRR